MNQRVLPHPIRLAALAALASLTVVNAEPTPAATASPSASVVTSPAAASPTATPKPRTPDDAVTPAVKDSARHLQFLYRKTEGDISLLFLGDSITDFWPCIGEWTWLKFAPYQPADFGVSGDRTEHLLWRITNGELDGIHPKVVVILIGTNNVGQVKTEKPEWAAEGVKKVVATVREKLPYAKVLLLGVFPRAPKGNVLRDEVAAINQIISKLDDGNKTRFLDFGNEFLDESGEFKEGVMPDKLHPSAKGYEIWYQAMSPLLDEMMK